MNLRLNALLGTCGLTAFLWAGLLAAPSVAGAWFPFSGGDTLHGRITSAVDTTQGLANLEVGAVLGNDTSRTLTDSQGYFNFRTNVGVEEQLPIILPHMFPVRIFPNPSAQPVIQFSSPYNADAELSIYNISGQKVKKLNMKSKQGVNGFLWNGRNENNAQVSDGSYIYKLNVGNKTVAGNFVIIKNGGVGRLEQLASGLVVNENNTNVENKSHFDVLSTMYKFYVSDPNKQWSTYKDDSLVINSGNKLENDRMIPNRRLDFRFMNGSDSVNTEVDFFKYMWYTDINPNQILRSGFYPYKAFLDTTNASSWKPFMRQGLNDWNNAVGSAILNEVTDTTNWRTWPQTRVRFRYVDNDTTYPIYGADGYCETEEWDSNNRPLKFNVWINLSHPLNDSDKVRTSRHELGHALLTSRHSLNRNHLMYVARGPPYNITLDESILEKVQFGIFPLKKVRNYWNP